MKKLLSSAIILIMLLCCATPCFGAEETLTNEKLSATHEVVAKYIRIYREEEGYTTLEGEDGKFSDTTDSGLKVELEVEGQDENHALIIHEITSEDEEAAKWFQKHFAGAANIAPLEIFMADENGKRYELPAGTEITLTGLKEGQYVVRFSADGHKDRIPEAVKDGSITFKTIEAADFYVVVTPATGGSGEGESESRPEGGGQDPEGQKPAKPQKPAGEPDTGEQSLLWLWGTLMVMSAAGIIIVAKEMKKA